MKPDESLQASNYASGFMSNIYPDRGVPGPVRPGRAACPRRSTSCCRSSPVTRSTSATPAARIRTATRRRTTTAGRRSAAPRRPRRSSPASRRWSSRRARGSRRRSPRHPHEERARRDERRPARPGNDGRRRPRPGDRDRPGRCAQGGACRQGAVPRADPADQPIASSRSPPIEPIQPIQPIAPIRRSSRSSRFSRSSRSSPADHPGQPIQPIQPIVNPGQDRRAADVGLGCRSAAAEPASGLTAEDVDGAGGDDRELGYRVVARRSVTAAGVRAAAHEVSRAVLLVSMPFGALERPALGLSLLKACLTRGGRRLRRPLPHLRLRRPAGRSRLRLGHATRCPTPRSPATGASPALHGEHPARDQAYVEEVLRGRVAAVGHRYPARAARALADRPVPGPLPGVGRLGTLRRRRLHLDVRAEHRVARAGQARSRRRTRRVQIVFGGANWEGEMGRRAPPPVPLRGLRLLRRGRAVVPGAGRLPSVAKTDPAERAGLVVSAGRRRRWPPAPVGRLDDLDALPVPDFADYFRDLAASGVERGRRSGAAVRDVARLLVGREVALHVLRAERRRDGVPQQEPGARPRAS